MINVSTGNKFSYFLSYLIWAF